MLVHVTELSTGEDWGRCELDLQSLRLDGYERPYAIVEHPFLQFETCRAVYKGDEWVFDYEGGVT